MYGIVALRFAHKQQLLPLGLKHWAARRGAGSGGGMYDVTLKRGLA